MRQVVRYQSQNSEENTATLSLIVLQNYHLNSKEHEVKGQPINMHDEHDITFIDHTDTIDIERHLSKTKIHSNKLPKKIEFSKKASEFLLRLH